MMKSRIFKHAAFVAILVALAIVFLYNNSNSIANNSENLVLSYKFDDLNITNEQNLTKLPIGEAIIEVAKTFIDTPYKSKTLEGVPEITCRYDFTGVDCVTFYENTYALAFAIKYQQASMKDFCKTLGFIRYKKMQYSDSQMYADTLLYSDRVHYSSEWIYYNCKRGLFEDITKEIGGEKLTINPYYMSKYSDKYSDVLAKDNAIQENIKNNEEFIKQQEFYYIPQSKIASIEDKLQNGDLVFITSNIPGLDYNHTGFIYVDSMGVRRLMHASSSKSLRKVVIGKQISKYVKGIKIHTGITILRPKELEY